MTADEAAFAALTRKISREAGLTLDAYKSKCLRRRIAVRMRACGVQTYADYQAVLDRSPAEYERLKEDGYDDSPWSREELQALAWERVKHEDWDEYDDLPEKP